MKILGFGKAVPRKIVTNDDLSKFVETSDEWIFQRTGIRERRISDENTSELAYRSAVDAIKNSNIDKNEIDLIVCATMTPDNFTPSVACMVQEKLELGDNVTAFDVNAACTGFVFALKIVASMLNTYHKRALVIGCETLSKIINFEDRNTCVLFGDGAGAIVVEKDEKNEEFYTCSLGNDKDLIAENVGMNFEMKNKVLKSGFLKMDGKEVFKFAINVVEKSINKILDMNNLKIEDINLIIPHQANQRIISNVAKKFNISNDKFFVNLEKYGNTSAASIPMALCEAFESKKITKGDKVILVGFGGGLTWGSTIIEI
ncbi:beta-ketoacyl-ACP synthase III [Parvimonas micra]|uniref:beta-ketoacyl-ACP synthase III n=1 Tax=Parvimonas micra TaxID=33033 RepID=UPI002B474C2B|nr:beta-ketoacyl-ACP synthase III [Parvimonas micra]MEB3060563.1 beta-ketoacyl-ACP synthase III [Parvimonas micra]MEB3066420.1 beta-ketoacyl-ACP synthase III [Parvimonas micra]